MSVDLHLHTTASDGSLTPRQMVEKAKSLGYDAIAITDHDTVEGLNDALQWGKKIDLEVISGIEINTELNGYEVHILGYFINYNYRPLLETLDYYRKLRKERVEKIIKKLKGMNINIYTSRVMELAGEGSVGRTHIARAMKEKGYVQTNEEAFNKYIGIGKPAYVDRERLTPGKSISIIEESGGLPVLAHPGLVGSDDIVKKIIDMGVMDLLLYYYEH